MISAKHCPNSLQYRGNAGSLDFGAPASDSTEGEVDMQFHRTLGSNTTSKKYQHYNGDDRFVTSVTTQTATDSGETRCHQGITTRFGCALLDDIGFCGYAAWGGTTHYVCHLVSTTNQVDDLGDSGGPWFDDTPGKAVGIHHGHVNGGDASVFTNINRASINLSATVRTN